MTTNMLYDAFLSYRHMTLDSAVTGALRRLLEDFRIPAGIDATKRGSFRVFMDEVELHSSPDLSQMIKDAATHAGCLFVICSRATRERSRWIDEEIDDFLAGEGGDIARIFPILIEGKPEEALPDKLLARYEQGVLEYLDITATTQVQVLENLKENKLWAQSRMVNIAEGTLDNHLRKTRTRRWIIGLLSAAVVLTGVIFGASYFMRQAQKGRAESVRLLQEAKISQESAEKSLEAANDSRMEAEGHLERAKEDEERAKENKEAAIKAENEAEASRLAAEESERKASESASEANKSRGNAESNRATADQSRKKAEEYTRVVNEAKNLAEKAKEEADQSRAASEKSRKAAMQSEKDAVQYQLEYENEQAKVQQAKTDYAENEIWARIVLYELELVNLRPLQARSYAKELLSEKGLTAEQKQAAQAIVEDTLPDTRLNPVYREEGELFAGYSPNGQTLLIGGKEGSLSGFDTETLVLLGREKNRGFSGFIPSFTTDSEYVALTSYDQNNAVSIYETRTLRRVMWQPEIPSTTTWNGSVSSAFFVPGTYDLYYCFGYMGLYKMNLEGYLLLPDHVVYDYNSVIAINEDTFAYSRMRFGYTSPYDPEIISLVYNASNSTLGEEMRLGYMYKHDTIVLESVDGKYIGLGANDGEMPTIYVFDRKTGENVWEKSVHEKKSTMFGFSGDGKKMMHGVVHGGVTIYEMGGKFKEIGQYTNFDDTYVNVAQLCLDWNKILFAYDTTLVLGDVSTNEILERVETAHTSPIIKIVVSPSGDQAVTLSRTEAIVWELQ